MSLSEILSKLTKNEKEVLFQNLIVSPTIEENAFMAKEEFGNIIVAGKKMGFSKKEIVAKIHKQTKEMDLLL